MPSGCDGSSENLPISTLPEGGSARRSLARFSTLGCGACIGICMHPAKSMTALKDSGAIQLIALMTTSLERRIARQVVKRVAQHIERHLIDSIDGRRRLL